MAKERKTFYNSKLERGGDSEDTASQEMELSGLEKAAILR